jgi:hypothetical protein
MQETFGSCQALTVRGNRATPILLGNRSGIPLPVALLAAALLLIVPVTARAGGEVPHVHALAHLLVDGQDARLDHHHRHDHDVSGRVTGSADAAPPPDTKAKRTRAATSTRTDVPKVAPATAAVHTALSVIALPDTAWFHQGWFDLVERVVGGGRTGDVDRSPRVSTAAP